MSHVRKIIYWVGVNSCLTHGYTSTRYSPHPPTPSPLIPPPQKNKKIMENHLFPKRSLNENEFNLELPPPEQKNQSTKRNQKKWALDTLAK